MVNRAINNLTVTNAAIAKQISENRYPADDVSTAELAYIAKHSAQPKRVRKDMQKGQVYVVLEGAYMAKKVVFLKQLENNLALVSGSVSHNGVSAFKIDERYLLKLEGVSVKIEGDVNVDESSIYESKINDYERMDIDAIVDEKKIDDVITKAISSEKFMGSYFIKDFTVDHSAEFYSTMN
ncbi:large subunit ribosomal protein L6e [Enteropsectra breve]|nr:large subunit ribosomal protein L6e [Enteropsectra breve]